MATFQLKIAKADISDAAEILSLQKLAFQTEAEIYGKEIRPLQEGLPEAQAAFAQNAILKATSSGKRIVGSVRGRMLDDGHTCHVGRLMVHPEFRRRGIAKALLLALEKEMPDASRFQLFTGALSVNNIKLYKSVGYQEFEKEQLVKDGEAPLVFLEKKRIKF